MKVPSPSASVWLVAILLSGCSARIDSDSGAKEVESFSLTAIGDPLEGLTAAQEDAFDEGLDEFAEVEDVEDGLGPVFNDAACGNCHQSGAIGGAGETVETRFGTITNGVFDPLTELGGSLIQAQGIGPAGTCNFVGETVPVPPATIIAQRLTTPLFGAGFVDAVPDATFESLAAEEAGESPSTAGRTNRVLNVVTGATVVGKFGWKAQVPTLFQFSGDAYVNEMGITNPFFPDENCPNGDCTLIEECDPVPDPEDDGAAVAAFTDFMTLLAPAPVLPSTSDTNAGRGVFNSVGCQNCHTPQLRTGTSPIAALNRKNFSPFSDFLLHDMGSLGDGIGAQGRATQTEMRTAPLWGARFRTRFLHDGRASSIDAAIRAHAGQGQAARDSFVNLNATQRARLIAFVNSI
jgi:CxxC motif-containing protein (DUF1111 family)